MYQQVKAATELQKQDLHEILDASHQALSCNSITALQQETLETMERMFGASSSVYGSLAPVHKRMRVVDGTTHGVPDGSATNWYTQFQNQDPFLQHYLNTCSSVSSHVVLSSETVNQKAFLASRFYTEFLRPQSVHHIMLIGLKPANSEPIAVIGMHRERSDKPFSEFDAHKANMLAPCVSAAVERIAAKEELSQHADANDPGFREGMHAILPQRVQKYALSSRQVDVVQLVGHGLTDAEIADQLGISVRTVSNHLRCIYEKADVHNRTALLYRLIN